MHTHSLSLPKTLKSLRVRQLVIGVLCLVVVSNLQYGWTLFVEPIRTKHQWTRTDIQWAFFFFVFIQTWLVPFEAYLIDRFGPRWMVCGGGFLVGLAWVTNAYADTLNGLYAGAVFGGIGSGIILGACYGNVVKWFSKNRGFATGLTAAGYGAGSIITVIPIANTIASSGYEHAFLYFGLGQGVILMMLALFMRAPSSEELDQEAPQQQGVASKNYRPSEVLKTPVFWVMYLMFALVASGGLMVIANMGPLAADFKIAQTPVSLLGLVLPALSFSLILERAMNGISRPFFGFVSDRIGRELTMCVAFVLEGIGVCLLGLFGHDPLWFVILGGLVFFAWGEIYSLFPSLCTDIFGRTFSSTNYGMLFTAKGVAAFLVPIASMMKETTGSWSLVFLLVALFDILAAALAVSVLWPLRLRYMKKV